MIAALALACALPALAQTEGESGYGCRALDSDPDLATIEGKDGVFFRLVSDLRMDRPFSDQTVANLAALSRALQARGTKLIYAPIPTKSVAMPDWLPDAAGPMGFDLAVATEVQADILRRLELAGVTTVDLAAALRQAEPGELAFFATDTHWTAHGADLAARAVADVLRAQPGFDAQEPTPHVTEETGVQTAFSGMRRILQRNCRDTLPPVETMTYRTTIDTGGGLLDIGLGDGAPAVDIGLGDAPALDIGLDDAPALDIGLGDESGAIDLFGADAARLPVALVGTSFTDLEVANFPGFVAQHAGVEVISFAITGGGQYGSITSYLTSDDFQQAPPAFLVWENPIYANLAQTGDQPLRELIAAAGGTCTTPVPVSVSADRMGMTAVLPAGLGPDDTLHLATDSGVIDAAAFHFWSADARVRSRSITRGARLRRTGHFYMPLTGLWPEGAAEVEIDVTAALGPAAGLFTCSPLPPA
ncbi:alginate O-acetyltransferase AlgX-related protein [Jannaschia sp. M317]|uniref:alginate O-acetyltransferase AlgX-related protein n=1 Tax=Jannaschia sp. M317 TaxID=2867011 RepID=UPI0021A75463|nr:hypothetical protein [Jannaschia sp. M317]UWQ17946.1 hypothetical protein K3551_01135 [Jannaschia sp. M317]